MKIVFVAWSALAIALPYAPFAEEWEGIWAADPAWCANAGQIGTAEQAPIRITPEALHGLENRCDITNLSPTGVGRSWRFDLSCAGEGVLYRESELLMVAENGILVRYTNEGHVIPMVRCP